MNLRLRLKRGDLFLMVSIDGYFYFYLLSINMKSTFPIISINVFPLNVSNTRPLTYGNVSNFLVNSDRVQKL